MRKSARSAKPRYGISRIRAHPRPAPVSWSSRPCFAWPTEKRTESSIPVRDIQFSTVAFQKSQMARILGTILGWMVESAMHAKHGHGPGSVEDRTSPEGSAGGFGAPLARPVDARLLAGGGRFVADFAPEGCLPAAFVRSPVPRAMIGEVNLAAAQRAPASWLYTRGATSRACQATA